MSLQYLAEDLITTVRNMAMLPDSDSTGTQDVDLLRVLNEAIRTYLVPRLLALREAFWVARQRQALGSTWRYRIPPRALFNKLQNVWWLDSNSDRQLLEPVSSLDIHLYGDEGGAATPAGYFLEGNDICLLPIDATSFSGTLEIEYFSRPNDLVLATYYAIITNVDTGTKTVTVDTWPTGASFLATSSYDIHSPYSGAELKEWDLTGSAVNAGAKTVTVNEAIDGSTFGRKPVAVGDYICLAESCALPALPRELHPVACRGAALRIAEALGDQAGMKMHGTVFEKQMQEILSAMESRVENRPMRITGLRGFV
jgi:hypothetical protein